MCEIENLFDLNEAIDWIKKNSFLCIALEVPVYLLKYSVQLVTFLNLKLNNSTSSRIEFYTIVLNCCSVDYVSPRHLNGQIDAIIRFGKCCLASLPKGIIEYPVLFMFENHFLNDQAINFMNNYLKDELNPEDALVIVDTNCLIPTLNLINKLDLKGVLIGKFIRFTDKWTFVNEFKDFFIDLKEDLDEPNVETNSSKIKFYNYLLDRELIKFKRLYFIGDQIPNSFRILSLLEVIHLNPKDQIATKIRTNKELMKRCSLIEKVKKLNRFGVVFTHSYPDVNPFIEKIQKLTKKKRKVVNFITLVQTTDEFKLGNFAALESLILVNNCYCSNLIDSINLHIPLINYTEFKISCGLKLEYGQVKWNEDLNDEELSDFESENKSNQLLVDNRNTAIVESYFKEDRWYGLQVDAGKNEISKLKQGLKGIAMGYQNDEKNCKKC